MIWLHSNIINPAVPGVYQTQLIDGPGNFCFKGWSFWDGNLWGNVRGWKEQAEHELNRPPIQRRVGVQNKVWLATAYNVVTPGCEQAVWLPINWCATARYLDLCFSRGDVYDIEVK